MFKKSNLKKKKENVPSSVCTGTAANAVLSRKEVITKTSA